MRRSSERLIDVLVLVILLGFAWLMRDQQPGLAGVIVAASIQFWMAKNATAPGIPDQVEIVGQTDAVDVDVVDKTATNGND